ncbi:transcription initiation factor IIB [Thermogladius calderae 1633]|uniref:Transcription initiation factor IIB n=1 Tax=Thermogladius calderae (strain DSM 22663 / VKM B-2946 / 1633) TaxID=1184251 RepID=I3TCS5_THEC1|nr:transcription initiation factor IIB [Thermogladius calderae 1633]
MTVLSGEKTSSTPSQSPNVSKCPPNKIIFDHGKGEYVCLETGEVIEERVIDERAEWRAFTPEERERRARTGGPITGTVHDMGFATSIDYADKDASGRRIIEKKAQLQKLRKWQARTRIQSSVDRNLAQALNELERIAELLNLPTHVREEAARIYRMAVEKGLVRGRSIESVIAAAVYVACREARVPRSLDEITKYTRIPRKEIARCYRLLLRELGIKVTAVDPIDFIPRIAHALGLSGEIIKNATEILNKVRNKGVTAGKDPAGLAAAAVYIAAITAGEKRTQKEVAHVAGVTEVTVRNRYKEIIDALGIQEKMEE